MSDNDIDKIIKNSAKADLIESLSESLTEADKVIVVVIQDKDNGVYTSQVLTLGIQTSYECCGILEIGKQDIMEEF